jgi:PAS domain S-box-containing protein
LAPSPTHEQLLARIEELEHQVARAHALEVLQACENRYSTLLDVAPYPVVVSSLEGKVTYLNPAFTEVFGWALEELEGKTIPYVPPGLQTQALSGIQRLYQEKIISRYETRRLTKDGRLLDVVMRGTVFSDADGNPSGQMVIIRDVTREKRIARNNEAMLRISLALPEYPELEGLLEYIGNQIRMLLNTEGALIILLDEERQELFFQGVAYDDTLTQRKIREARFSVKDMNQIVDLRVFRTGEPVVVPDTSQFTKSYPLRDQKLGYKTKSFIQVPLKSKDRIIGILTAINKKEGVFDTADSELLSMIGATVALSIENARFSEDLKKAYREVSSLNRAKDKVFNHLSHELKTPVSVLSGSLMILERKMRDLPEASWRPVMERVARNLERIAGIQYEVEDIIQGNDYRVRDVLSFLLDQCADALEVLVNLEADDGAVIDRIRRKIDELFGPKQAPPEKIDLSAFVAERLKALHEAFFHRGVESLPLIQSGTVVFLPQAVLQKTVDGLIRNAVEHTPDEGKLEVIVRHEGDGSELIVRDYGVGITEENQRRIFEGFFPTQPTLDYSSRRPFDFDAGGKGADLLRMKIFGERYGFRIEMTSSRCPHIPTDEDKCPGRISACPACRTPDDCHGSGGTSFSIHFPPVPAGENAA